jgi:heme-degrading monooxygenase HmoA
MIRIVRMTFQEDKTDEFLKNFNVVKNQIRSFDGVEYLELLGDKENANVYFTYSIWKSEKHLEKYRNSDLFKSVWAKTKPLFAEKAQAWSVDSVVKLA